jgi:hypothetical protein
MLISFPEILPSPQIAHGYHTRKVVRRITVLWTKLVAVFFDSRKLHDTTWTYSSLRIQHRCNLINRQPRFVSFVLHYLHFRVRHDNVFSAPKRNVVLLNLAVTLFAVAINGTADVDAPCFIITVRWRRHRLLRIPEHYHSMTRLQTAINRLPHEALQNCFFFFAAITQRVKLTRLQGLYLSPSSLQ